MYEKMKISSKTTDNKKQQNFLSTKEKGKYKGERK